MNLMPSVRFGFREARGSWRKLLTFAIALCIGIGAMVCARSAQRILEGALAEQSKSLLGADVVLSSREPIPPEVVTLARSLSLAMSQESRVRTMARSPSGRSHIAQLRAIEGGFPFYGTMLTDPPGVWETVRDSPEASALLDEILAEKLAVKAGDAVVLGAAEFKIAGVVQKTPGDTAPVYAFAPRVFINRALLDKTDLVVTGSIADYSLSVLLPVERTPESFLDSLRSHLSSNRIESTTVKQRQDLLGEVGANLTQFFSLVGLCSLFIGGLGAGACLQFYLRQKRPMVGALKCIGASPQMIALGFSVQIIAVGATASLVGSLGGATLAASIPSWFQEFIPFNVVGFFSWSEVFIGTAVGSFALLFLVGPVLQELSRMSPASILRSTSASFEHQGQAKVALTSAILVVGLSLLSVSPPLRAVVFSLSLGIAGLLLGLFAGTLATALRRVVPLSASFVIRHAARNLSRPGGQTTLLVLTFGLGTFLLGVTIALERMLEGQAAIASESTTSAYLFDIQIDQRDVLHQELSQRGFKVTQEVPTVLMRLTKVRDRMVSEILKEQPPTIPPWTLHREYWSTYRRALLANESVVAGDWIPVVSGDSSLVPVSIEDRLAEKLQVGIGDQLEFDIAGIPLRTEISSIRDILWERMERNSFLVFPEGVLESAPQFFVFGVVTRDASETARLSRVVSSIAPNVSVLDVRGVVETVRELLGIIGYIAQALGLLIIAVGCITLLGVLAAGQSERTEEQALLRVIGARRSTVTSIFAIEYVLLAGLGSFVGLFLASVAVFPLGWYVFKIPPVVPIEAFSLVTIVLMVLVLSIAWVHRSFGPRHSPASELRIS